MNTPQTVVVSAKAIIVQNDRVLIIKQLHQGTTYWDLPGGKMEFGETPEQTVLREVKEETDLTVSDIKLLGTWQFFSIANQRQQDCQRRLWNIWLFLTHVLRYRAGLFQPQHPKHMYLVRAQRCWVQWHE